MSAKVGVGVPHEERGTPQQARSRPVPDRRDADGHLLRAVSEAMAEEAAAEARRLLEVIYGGRDRGGGRA